MRWPLRNFLLCNPDLLLSLSSPSRSHSHQPFYKKAAPHSTEILWIGKLHGVTKALFTHADLHDDRFNLHSPQDVRQLRGVSNPASDAYTLHCP
jgi:hypothetical protein